MEPSENLKNLLENEETQAILNEGRAAFEFLHSRFYHFVLDWAEKRCNTSLGKVRGCVSDDAQVCKGTMRRWQQDERWLIDLQEYVVGNAKNYEDLVRTNESVKGEQWVASSPVEFPSDRDGGFSPVTTGM